MSNPLGIIEKDQDTPRFLISDLCAYLEEYLSPDHIREVYRAYLFGAEAHVGQHRKTGEPYIYHPVAVARILATMRMDYKCLMAAILHDVIEDTPTAKEQLADTFDAEIAELVDGVSKLSKIDFNSQAEAQAASLRKMLLAMTKDIRVILIKLADRLHNMRTLGVMRPDKSRRIAKETLDIFAPIANRLGINSMRLELEELGFAAYWPMRYRALKGAVADARGHHRELIENVEKALSTRLQQEDFQGEVNGRQKHLYSIYKKMVEKKLSFSEVVDVFAFRIVVDRVDTCYRVLGVVHNLYKPMPGRFKDYIAIPKANGYQSLHTVLFGPQGIPIEIQIRTEEMDKLAESGIAAHWMYKTGEASGQWVKSRASDWLQNLLEMQQGVGDSMEFLEHVKVDLFPDEVYVFTPRGRIMVLPKGATVVDFAYSVHTDVGNTCVAARVDRRLVPLRTRLHNGQTVEIINSETAGPSPAWLNFVVTGKARANIRSYLKNLQDQEAVNLGRRLLERELNLLTLKLEEIDKSQIDQVLEEFRLENLDSLLAGIALGNHMPLLVARRLAGEEMVPAGSETGAQEAEPSGVLAIRGTEGMVVNFAKCCWPIPDDAIVGVFNPGKGIVIHRQGCPNLGDYKKHGHKWIEAEWEPDVQGEFATKIKVESGNQRGVLASVASVISQQESNIEHVGSEERDGLSSTLVFVITVKNRLHLARIMRQVRSLPSVMRISRLK
ncbi:MAG: bifunctional GTP diphosphokinase/guanosine-3',5'-bis pyrophosphate 3'-pyrophosphohydrolase [Candidatus Thiodiazotropha lotti]|uniref:guanosine-3',5'-bis(diphosphate) 3'-diphosphatase n=1 Tax=Candidatus Thiodiazotropha endoloripes TaxID=1818881 RepID=A0A1E2UP28_9GAMM|nr:bifunctional GTP diphosphokinase/guanosine-3',5'-bis pyrophosphate 3'-pyrophosphohydrolase [Candidatus Thiodiazotropha endoloripes]MCG7899082.1 bifunctional GTP diphosphokinase/guanosine-3',5'-bis pyrophosphate 3'-pyrophosphohydrolase [Candidatus Thiodiazotropha weberae]MCG7993487.1 bifunctional GTP diphosphokinase/guanosine-3',5'-bis pyrophosphate 3'-pyrophosphohydrolase [Candidatus Thiodiazotropha lotti]MCG7901165.1 bifunctional GTP diphosphokinase/guanosine-3',5'-bis pyrophosphate 3'-pyrop